MSLVERKRFELKQKLHSLYDEFEMWQSESRELTPLEKHNSQIHRITTLLKSHSEVTQETLEGLTGNAEELLKQSTHLERQILELHRIWEFFRSKFALRSVKWFSSYLEAADEFAWSCYEKAQSLVVEEHVARSEIKEPPLVFFNGGLSPFSMPRRLAFQAEEVPREGLKTEKFIELLGDLPVPLIGIPWFQIQYLPDALVIGHEVGHIVRDDFRLGPRTEALLKKGFKKGKVRKEHWQAWLEWLDEVFADIYGTLATGPAFVGSLMDFLAMGKENVVKEKRTNLNWGSYPTVYLRILLNLEVLGKLGFEEQREQLQANWKATFDSHAMTEFVDDIEPIVESLIAGPYPEFGDVSLTDVVTFSQSNQQNATDAADSLLQGGPIQEIQNVRELYAASRYAFADDSAGYEEQDVQRVILDKILAMRETGVRNEDFESFDERDNATGRNLFNKLTSLLGD